MTDRSAEIADFVIASLGVPPVEIESAITRRWPGATDDEIDRGFAIAEELLRGDGAECHAEAAILDDEARRRRDGGADE